MRFIKYHGLGNDFILTAPDQELTPELARTLCQRGFGIGADGLMRAAPPVSSEAHLRMDLINSDGSYPEMCGNGLRCLVRHAVEDLDYQPNPLLVDTGAGVLSCQWRYDEAGNFWVRVAMGQPRVGWEALELRRDHIVSVESNGLIAVNTSQGLVWGLPINTGNPHFVLFGDSSRDKATQLGPELECHPVFPLKANIEFSRVLSPKQLRTTVWERGCGLTLACGTGATASAVAAHWLHLLESREILVHLPGGTLHIELDTNYRQAWMEGPAQRSFHGEWKLPANTHAERWD